MNFCIFTHVVFSCAKTKLQHLGETVWEYPLLSYFSRTVVISKIENNIKEVRLSTLQRIVEHGLGGQLQLSIKL
jgi:hypothetical protein